VKAVDGFGQSVVVAISDHAYRGLDVGLGHAQFGRLHSVVAGE
jgi:hypothetical protein